jgi:DnaK suppressor protein
MNANSSNSPSSAESSFQVPAPWRWHWRTLHRLRDQLQQQTREHFVAAATLQKADDPDFASLGSEESEFQALIAEVKSEEGLLSEVLAAIDRLRHGTYGLCEATGQPIAPERLRALPWTRFTRDAAAQRER